MVFSGRFSSLFGGCCCRVAAVAADLPVVTSLLAVTGCRGPAETDWSPAAAVGAVPSGLRQQYVDEAEPPAVTQPVSRFRELVSERSAFAKTFESSDGRREVELSTAPAHCRAASGRWRATDTTGRPTDEPGFGLGAENGAFSALFGERGDRLMRVELGSGSWVGAAGYSGPRGWSN